MKKIKKRRNKIRRNKSRSRKKRSKNSSSNSLKVSHKPSLRDLKEVTISFFPSSNVPSIKNKIHS